MVESTALEMRHTGNRIGGSNPSLSATLPREEIRGLPAQYYCGYDVEGLKRRSSCVEKPSLSNLRHLSDCGARRRTD